MLWGSGAIFLRLVVRIEKNKSMKEFVRFSTTDVFVPVSQLSTRDLFDFLENLKIKQDMFLSWISRQVRSVEQRALWFPYSRLFFGIVFKRVLFLEYFGIFTKSIVVSILDLWHISFRKMFELLTCKNKSWLLSLRRHVLNRLQVDRHGSGFLFSLAMLKRKAPLELDAMFWSLFLMFKKRCLFQEQ